MVTTQGENLAPSLVKFSSLLIAANSKGLSAAVKGRFCQVLHALPVTAECCAQKPDSEPSTPGRTPAAVSSRRMALVSLVKKQFLDAVAQGALNLQVNKL